MRPRLVLPNARFRRHEERCAGLDSVTAGLFFSRFQSSERRPAPLLTS